MKLEWSQEDVPEWVPEEERQVGEDGVVRVKPEGWTYGDVDGLKSTVQKTREERDQWQSKFKSVAPIHEKITEAGLSVDELLEAHQKVAEGWTPPADTQAAVEEAKRNVASQKDREITALRERLDSGRKRDETRAVEDQARQAALKAGFDEDALQFVIPSIVGRGGVFRDDQDRIHVRAVDPNGSPVMSRRGTNTDDMTLEELATDVIRKDPAYARFLKGADAGGGGGSAEDSAVERVTTKVRQIPLSAALTEKDMEDIMAGKAVRI